MTGTALQWKLQNLLMMVEGKPGTIDIFVTHDPACPMADRGDDVILTTRVGKNEIASLDIFTGCNCDPDVEIRWGSR